MNGITWKYYRKHQMKITQTVKGVSIEIIGTGCSVNAPSHLRQVAINKCEQLIDQRIEYKAQANE